METDYTSLTEQVTAKVWETMNLNAGNLDVAPLEEQDDMVKFNLKSQVLPFVTVITPVIKAHIEAALKQKIAAVINESHEAGHDADFTLLAVSAELSEDEN
jgi:hypothetical protein